MFEKLVEVIASCWERLCFLEIVHVYEQAGVLRWGHYNRTLMPGTHWRWPVFEQVISILTCTTTYRSPPQTLTTKDDKSIVVAVVVKYHIEDIRPYICEVWDQQDVLGDVTMGAVYDTITSRTYEELLTKSPKQQVMDLIRKQVNKYGFRIESVTFTDFGKVRSIRLIQPQPQNLAN